MNSHDDNKECRLGLNGIGRVRLPLTREIAFDATTSIRKIIRRWKIL